MATKGKMKKEEDQEVQKIDSKELEQIKQLVETLSKISQDITSLEVNKTLAVQRYIQLEQEFSKIKEKLTYKYGDMQLDIQTGIFTEPQKENEPSNTEN